MRGRRVLERQANLRGFQWKRSERDILERSKVLLDDGETRKFLEILGKCRIRIQSGFEVKPKAIRNLKSWHVCTPSQIVVLAKR